MQIFLSYPSERRDVAEPLALALRDRGHEVFFDRDDLGPGNAYTARIEEGIKAADLMIFLISPESVQPGRFTLTELGFARKHWRGASRRILPVMVAPTDMAQVPAFAKAVNILTPKGNLVAEVAAAVDDLRGLEYALLVGLQVSAIALMFGLLSYFCFQSDGEAIRAWYPLGKRLPAPEVGLLFAIPVGIAVWQWGLRRWWAFCIPIIIVTACYWVSAPTISELTIGQVRNEKTIQVNSDKALYNAILVKIEAQIDAKDMSFLQKKRDEFLELDTSRQRVVAALIIGAVMAFGTMVSLGLVLPQFRSVFRWLVVTVTGAAISAFDTFVVLGGVTPFSAVKAMLLIVIWQVVFGALLGYWLARGRTTVSA